MSNPPTPTGYSDFHTGIVDLLETARRTVARSVNALMTASYCDIGRRIVEFEQGGEGRAGYGEALLKRLGDDLTRQFGRGFAWRNLTQMRAFYLAWPNEQILQTLSAKSSPLAIHQTPSEKSVAKLIVQALSAQSLDLPTPDIYFPLPWSAYAHLLSFKNPAAHTFYETEVLRSGWPERATTPAL